MSHMHAHSWFVVSCVESLHNTVLYSDSYRICPNRSRAQIQAGALIEAGSERSVS